MVKDGMLHKLSTSGKKYFVTGATGFIGQRLCANLQQAGCKVVASGRSAKKGPWNEFKAWDASDNAPELVGVNSVLHLAGKVHALSKTRQDEVEYFHINTEGTCKLLEAAREAGVRRFVFFSSVKAMDEGGPDCLDETSACHPETPYGRSKLEAERLVLDGNFVPEPVVLRLSMVYGPTTKGNLPRMIGAVYKGRFPPLPETGNKRSMVHADDVVAAALLAAEKPAAAGQTYIVTDGEAYSTRQIYEWICEALGRSVPSWSVPVPVLRGVAGIGDVIGRARGRRFMFDSDALEKLTGSAWYDSGKIRRELGFDANIHLHEALPEIVRFLKERR